MNKREYNLAGGPLNNTPVTFNGEPPDLYRTGDHTYMKVVSAGEIRYFWKNPKNATP